MKVKLTLTIDQGVSHRAKSLAREPGSSLSQLVENLLAEQTGAPGGAAKKAPFAERWTGRAELADKEDVRFRKLKEKYRLENPV